MLEKIAHRGAQHVCRVPLEVEGGSLRPAVNDFYVRLSGIAGRDNVAVVDVVYEFSVGSWQLVGWIDELHRQVLHHGKADACFQMLRADEPALLPSVRVVAVGHACIVQQDNKIF